MQRSHLKNKSARLAAALASVLVVVTGAGVHGQTAGQSDPDGLPGYPVHLQTADGLITIYQPQLTAFADNKLSTRAAASILAPGQTDPSFGVLWLESHVATDRTARTVRLLDVGIANSRFPATNAPNPQALADALWSALAQQPTVLSLDQVTAMLAVVEKEKETARDLSTDPPRIMVLNHPAVLVQYDGPPQLTQAPNSNILRAVNTPFFVALDPNSRTYFLKGAGRWYSASDAMGPFQDARQIPGDVAALADAGGYRDPQQPLPGDQSAAIEIVTATEPTELVSINGPELLSPISNTDLLYVTNTSSDVFFDIDNQQIFMLLSGRWYSAPHRVGPWTYVQPDKLPPDFARIPAGSAKASVLAQVSGTQVAKEAVADSYVPQTAAIDRRNYEPPPVVYDGEPNFQPIETTSVSYAVNCPVPVLYVRNRYYCCHNAVWYTCETSSGQWDVCSTVPVEIYEIPPSCPVYPVRYVYVYDSTPEYVYCGYTSGYTGCYRQHGVVVYGTGYRYHPWVGHEYYARPVTYGYAARYDERDRRFGFAAEPERRRGWISERDREGEGRWFGPGGYRPVREERTVDVKRDDGDNRDNRDNRDQSRPQPIVRHDGVYDRRKDVRKDALPVRRDFVGPTAGPAQHHEDVRSSTPAHHETRNDGPHPIDVKRPEEKSKEEKREEMVGQPNGAMPRRSVGSDKHDSEKNDPNKNDSDKHDDKGRIVQDGSRNDVKPDSGPKEDHPPVTQQPRVEDRKVEDRKHADVPKAPEAPVVAPAPAPSHPPASAPPPAPVTPEKHAEPQAPAHSEPPHETDRGRHDSPPKDSGGSDHGGSSPAPKAPADNEGNQRGDKNPPIVRPGGAVNGSNNTGH